MKSLIAQTTRRTLVRFTVAAVALALGVPALEAAQSGTPGPATSPAIAPVPATVSPAAPATAQPTPAATEGTEPVEAEEAQAPEPAPATERPQVGEDTEPTMETVAVPDKPADQQPESGGAPEPAVVASLSSTRTQDFGMVGVTWEGGSAPADLEVQVRTRTEGAWTAWEPIDVDDAQVEGEGSRGGTDPVWVGESDGVGVRLISAADAPEDVQVSLIDGGTGLAEPADFSSDLALMAATTTGEEPAATPTATPTADETGATATATTAVTPKPAIVTRRQWGVDQSYETDCSAPLTAPASKGVVIHHTAGANGYTADEAPGIVRGIHLYHTKSRGWCDIGYNFLVDAFGTVYMGRRGGQNQQVRGAHAGNWDFNLYTTGISMIGNYDTVAVPEATKKSVIDLTAWRLSLFDLNAIGKLTLSGGTVDIISGHRDIALSGAKPATSTACPGRYGYEWLNGGMRDQVQALIDEARANAPEPTPTPTVTPTPSSSPTPSATPTPTPTVTPTPEPVMRRLAGSSRYSTAAAISKQAFPNRNGTVFLASGESFPDALSGGPAAAGAGAPILLAKSTGIPQETVEELQRLQPDRIFVLGGESALSAAVAEQAAAYAERVIRLQGSDRYDTAARISQRLWSNSDIVYVTSGTSYPDALSGGALAARKRAPILLTDQAVLPQPIKEELVRLNPTKVVVLGGTSAVSLAVQKQLAQAVPGVTVSRLQGSNRYATSAAIAKAGWRATERAYFAAGTDFPDALAGVPAAGTYGAPLLLTKEACLPGEVADVADALKPDDRVLLGGSAVLADSASTKRC